MLVDRDHIALDLDALIDDAFDILFIIRPAHHVKDFFVGDIAVFDHLGHAVGKGTVRQGGEHRGVDQHQPRLVKRADQIFALRQVDARFAADRGIHLREQGGRDLAERHAAQEGRRGKAGDVAHHAAAQRDDQILAGHARGEHVVVDALHGRKTLVLLARGDDRVRDRQGQLPLQCVQIQRRDRRIRDDMHAAGGEGIQNGLARAGGQAAFDQNVGHAVRARQAQGLHC